MADTVPGGPRDSVIALLGLPDDEPWSWAAADAEAQASNEALSLFSDLYPLVDGDGLADYLRNLAAEVGQLLNDYDDLRTTLRAVEMALEGPAPVTPSQADRQPPASSSETKGGQDLAGPDT